MRFRAVHKLASYLMVLTALGALSFGGNLDEPVLVLTVLAVVVSLFLPDQHSQGALWQSSWTVATFVALGLCVLHFLVRNDLVISTVSFLLFLLVNKLFNRRAGRDYLQLYVITFMMVIAGSVLNVGVSFALFFVLYIVATTWALILFHLRREMEENYLIKHSTDRTSERVAVDRILNSRRIVGGWFLLGTSLMSLTVFGLAVGVFLFFPRIGTRASSPQGRGPHMVTGFSDRLTLGGHGRLRDNPEVVMRVYLGGLPPGTSLTSLHYRGATFDRYAGGRWYRSPDAPRPRVSRDGHFLAMAWDPLPGTPSPLFVRVRRRTMQLTRQEVFQEPLGTDVLFTAGQPLAVDLREKTGLRQPGFRVAAGGELRANLGEQGGRYVLYTDLRRPSRAVLAATPAGPLPRPILVHYLAAPDEIPTTVRSLGERLAQGRPHTLAKVEAVLAHLRKGFRYSRTLPRTGKRDPVAHFLFKTRAGHCEYFASAMVLLLRAGGVPSRVVTGFLGGAWNRYGEYVAIRQGDAHAWVEVWFPEHGWVTFDPTPPTGLEPLPSEGLLARLQMLLDSLRLRWQRWVIDYDVYEQTSLFQALRRGLARIANRARSIMRGGVLAPTIAALLALAALAWVILHLRRRRRRGPRTDELAVAPRGSTLRLGRMVARWLRELGRLGLARAPGETLQELACRLDSALPGLDPSGGALVRRYYRLRYGPFAPSRAELDALELDLGLQLEAAQPRRQDLAPPPGPLPRDLPASSTPRVGAPPQSS